MSLEWGLVALFLGLALGSAYLKIRRDVRALLDLLERLTLDTVELQIQVRQLRSSAPPSSYEPVGTLGPNMFVSRLRVPSGGVWLHRNAMNNDVWLNGGEYPIVQPAYDASRSPELPTIEEIKVGDPLQ